MKRRESLFGLGAFVRRYRRKAHFGSQKLQQLLGGHGAARVRRMPVGKLLVQTAEESPQNALTRMESGAAGLHPHEAAKRLVRYGPNEVDHEKPLPHWLHLWICYKNPFNLLLTALAALSYSTGDNKGTTVIAVMVVLSTSLRFVQEGRSRRTADSLRAMVSNTATVIRAGVASEVPIRVLVPGDVLALSAGDMIAADCRVISARNLFVAQSALTGESNPVEKTSDAMAHTSHATPLQYNNLAFLGTNVVSGTATALVVATGGRTYFGTLAASASATDDTPNAFQSGVNSVSWLLIRFALVMVPLVLLVNGFSKGDWPQAFLFALSVAVGLTPEMLPMIVTSTLAKGALVLSRKKVVVKRLDAIQNFGAMDVLCTDKTGTLTQDRIALAHHVDIFGKTSDEVLNFAFLNSHYQTGLKNLLDHAVLEHVELVTELQLEHQYRKIDEIPFDFERRRMSVVVSEQEHHHELICKGALQEVLAVCSQVRIDRGLGLQDVAIDAELTQHIQQLTTEMGQHGLRVVAVAMKELPLGQASYSVADESKLTLLGYVAFLDPPKDSAAPALAALAAHGVQVKVLSGDNELVTAHVCRQVGLAFTKVLSGSEIDALSEQALGLAVEQHQVFAKLTPLHKERIVRTLRARDHVVGFLGDGINDAPALRAADIGISVDSAVDIAKEAADIILLEKSLLVLDQGVVEGRKTFSNMLKYIRMTASSNFGNVLSVLLASVLLPFLPMLPLQLLVQNLLYDISQTGIPFDNVDAELVAQPMQWKPQEIGRFMLYFGPISSVIDMACFAVMWWVLGANQPALQGLFQSGWFVVGLLTQTLVVHMIRTPKIPFVQSRAALPLIVASTFIIGVGLYLPMGPLAGYFKLQALPPAYFAWLLALLAGYAALTTVMKRHYLRRFGWQ